MSNDILGYNRTANAPGNVMTGDYGLLDLGGAITLVSQINVQYGQQIDAFRAVGSPDLSWLTGEPMGALSSSSAVSKAGFFSQLPIGACGTIEQAVVSLGGKGNCAQINSGSAIHIKDAVTRSLSVTIGAGNKAMMQGFEAQFAFLSL